MVTFNSISGTIQMESIFQWIKWISMNYMYIFQNLFIVASESLGRFFQPVQSDQQIYTCTKYLMQLHIPMCKSSHRNTPLFFVLLINFSCHFELDSGWSYLSPSLHFILVSILLTDGIEWKCQKMIPKQTGFFIPHYHIRETLMIIIATWYKILRFQNYISIELDVRVYI